MPIQSIEEAVAALADPSNPGWSEAFGFLASHPASAALVLDAFQATLAQMGVEPSGADPASGEPRYSPSDVARAMGVPESELDASIRDASN
jgi:hypothetical protein